MSEYADFMAFLNDKFKPGRIVKLENKWAGRQGYVGYEQARLDIWNEMIHQYSQICIAENAFQHDVGYANRNYGQRRLALEDLADYLCRDGAAMLQNLRDEINKQNYTKIVSDDGTYEFKTVDD